MANAASTIEIELEIRDAINRLDRLQRELTQSTQSFNKAAQATRKFEGAINKAKAGLVAFFAAISIQKLAQLSDAMTQFENRVKLATNSLVQQLAVQQQLFQVAQKTALPLEDVGQLYSRLRIAAEQLGASQRDLINLTETVGLALKASGTSAASAQGALLQLGQALNSPRVQAEEFNSLIDGMPNLLREVEKQLGLTAGGLKKFVTDGQLSNKKFFDAILASQKALTQQANSSASTIEQANQRVANSFTSLIGAIDDKLGASKFFTGFIDGLASGIDKLSNFLGLTTQATGGGGGANLDEVIKEQTGLITDLEASFEGLSIYATTAIISFSELFEDANLTLEEYIKNVETFVEGYASYYDRIEAGEIPGFPALQIDPKTGEQLFLSAEQARKEFELIFKFIAQGFKAFENLNGEAEKYLTYLERITNYLSEQLRLLELSEENANRTAGAIVSGVSGAGPNASRAANIAQSKSIEEAAAKLILSNEKVAAAIDKSFEILFDILDPILDVLGDLLSAINRLIGALLEGIGNAIETNLDAIGLGPDSYYGGGGFTRDIEALGGGAQGGPYQPSSSEAVQIAAITSLREIVDGQEETLQNLIDAAEESGNLTGVIEAFKNSINNLIPTLINPRDFPEEQTFEQIITGLLDNWVGSSKGQTLQEVVEYLQGFIDSTTGEDPRAEAYLAVGTAELIIQELAEKIAGSSTSVTGDFQGISDLVIKTAQEQIDSIHFQNLTAQEQIDFRNAETLAILEQQKVLIELVADEEKRTQLLAQIQAAETKQLELYNLQISELQKLNEEREREANLLALQNIESGLQALLRDFERTIENIADLVQGLFDQVNELLFSDFNLAGPQETFNLAQDTYESLLENAFDPDATEEDIKALQGFVNEYLTAARNVFKSSTAFTDIFEAVLGDLTGLGIQTSVNAPIGAVNTFTSGAEELLGDLPEELQTAVSDMISGLNLATLAFAQQQVEFLTTVYQIELELNEDDFTIDVSKIRLDLGTITPIATAGTPHLGTITPTVSLDTSSLTSAFSTLTTAVNDAITSFVNALNTAISQIQTDAIGAGDFASLAAQGTSLSHSQYLYADKHNVRYTIFSTKDGNQNISDADYAATIKSKFSNYDTSYKYVLSARNTSDDWTVLNVYKDIAEAEKKYNDWRQDPRFVLTKYGFRQGGLVPDPMDTIPAMLSPGEYILSPETVRRYGVSNLNRLNAGDTAAINATSDPEVKRLLAELIVAVKENDTEVNVYTDMQGQTKASIEEFRSELRERTRRQGDKFLPARYI